MTTRLPCLLLLGALASVALAARPNVLLICIDDLRPELGCYGVDHIRSPHLDRLASEGALFSNHYVQAPTCGASRFSLLTGTYNRSLRGNGSIFRRAATLEEPPRQPSLPRHFRNHGYTTVSIGKVSHHPGGRGGPDWDDDSKLEMPGAWDRHLLPAGPWQHPRGFMHGLAHGEIRKRAKDMAVYQAEPGPDTIYPDGLTTAGALAQLEALQQSDKPFSSPSGCSVPTSPSALRENTSSPTEISSFPLSPIPRSPSAGPPGTPRASS